MDRTQTFLKKAKRSPDFVRCLTFIATEMHHDLPEIRPPLALVLMSSKPLNEKRLQMATSPHDFLPQFCKMVCDHHAKTGEIQQADSFASSHPPC